MPRVRWAYAAAVAVGLAVLPLASPAVRAQSGADYPRILGVDASRLPQITLDVVVPPLLAGQVLTTDAFSVVQDGRPLAVTAATPLPPNNLRLLLVLDTGVEADTLAAEQGAARDFLLELPRDTEVGVVAADPEPDVVSAPGTDRAETIRALVELRPTPRRDGDAASTLELALSQLPAEKGTGVVVAVDAKPTATVAPAAVTSTVTAQRARLYALVLVDPPAGYLGGLPERSGGRTLQVEETDRMLSAYDTVADELRGRYRVVFQSPPGGVPAADLIVSASGVTATNGFTVPPVAAASPTERVSAVEGSTRKRTSSTGIRLFAGALLAVLLVRLAWRVVRREE